MLGRKIAKFVGAKNVEGSSCFLGVSMGPSYYAGESLQAILDLINRSKFDKHFVMYADALNAYNIMVNDPHKIRIYE